MDEYVSSLPQDKKNIILKIREAVNKAAPEVEEVISYNMPALKLHGVVIYYAAWKDHIGFYGVSSTIANVFEKELKPHRQSKGTVQFPYTNPLPLTLITRMVKHRVKENIEKAKAKKAQSK